MLSFFKGVVSSCTTESVFSGFLPAFLTGVNKLKAQTTVSMTHILQQPRAGGILLLDLDDTVGRVPQMLGLDPWFRYRVTRFASEGHTQSGALLAAIEIYNRAQLASKAYVPVDHSIDIARQINSLKTNGIDVIGVTARNFQIAEQTHLLLDSLGVTFSADALKDGRFVINDKIIEAKNGVLFVNGQDKGKALQLAGEHKLFDKPLSQYSNITFVDDSLRNCENVIAQFNRMSLACLPLVYHYDYAAKHLPFDKHAQRIADIQEESLNREGGILLSDEQAQEELAQNFVMASL
jgi:hypothetical protein